MIDSESGVTIISESLVRELKLKRQSDPDNIIVTASGENVKTNGRVEGLEIVMGNKEFTTDAIILPVNGYQILIGNDTLDPLGASINFKDHEISMKDGKENMHQTSFQTSKTGLDDKSSMSLIKNKKQVLQKLYQNMRSD